MKKAFGFILIFLLGIRAAWPEGLPVWEFPQALSEWNTAMRLTVSSSEDGALLELTARDSYFVNPVVALFAETIGGFAIEYRAEGFTIATSGQIYYATEDAPAFGEDHRLVVGSLTTDGSWHTLKVLTDDNWRSSGKVIKLRLDLADQFPGKIWLRRIRALPLQRSRAELRGIPETVPLELGNTEAVWKKDQYDPKAERFVSPMTAPANGGFEYAGNSFLRKEFDLAKPVQAALLVCSCDDQVQWAELNGHRILQKTWSDYWKKPDYVELSPAWFKEGRNVLCLKYRNGGGLGGVMADLLDGVHRLCGAWCYKEVPAE